MTTDHKRYTVRGSDDLEKAVAAWMDQAAERLRSVLRPEEFRAVILIGGYGRGEGGVEIVDGRERPHNNFDFLVIAGSGADLGDLQGRAADALKTLATEIGIGMDVSCVREGALRRSPCLVMWYDMRSGHKTVLGDANLVPSLERFTVDRIVPFDVARLIVNRGTLLLINEFLLGSLPPSEAVRREVIKHGMKAVIGYGDGLLFFQGEYHWSYREKQRRMARLPGVPDSFRTLYDEALEFRFSPDYGDHRDLDLNAWNARLKEEGAPIHLTCEARRLCRDDLRWEDYPEVAARSLLLEDPLRPRSLARKLWHLSRSRPAPGWGGLLARLGCRSAGPRRRLTLLFPVMAYGLGTPRLEDLVRKELGSPKDPLRAYLAAWGKHADPNFPASLKRLGATLEDPP